MSKKILFFTAPWCAGCKTLKPHLEKLHGKVEVETIDVEQQPDEAAAYGVVNLPTLFFIHDDELVKHRSGASEMIIRDLLAFAQE